MPSGCHCNSNSNSRREKAVDPLRQRNWNLEAFLGRDAHPHPLQTSLDGFIPAFDLQLSVPSSPHPVQTHEHNKSQEANPNVIHNCLSKPLNSASLPHTTHLTSIPRRRSQGCSISATRTDTIPPYSKNTRRPANIPLHTLSSASRPVHLQQEESSRPLIAAEVPDEKGESRSSISADSDFSLWSDTGDLVDQLADQEDPLRIRLRHSLEEELPRISTQRRGRPQKQVRYHPDVQDNEKAAVLRKEDIYIPEPPQRKLNFGERCLVAIMAPNDGPSRIHGLHGKKLMYVCTFDLSHSYALTQLQLFHNHFCIIGCFPVWL